MKVMRYCALIIFFSNSLCYGLDGSRITHAGLATVKMGFGFFFGYTAMTTLLKPLSSLDNEKAKNELLNSLKYIDFFYESLGIKGVLFQDKLCVKSGFASYEMDFVLNFLLSRLFFIGANVYGTYKCTTSAYESLKEALKKRTNPAVDHSTEELIPKDEKKDLADKS